jgi:hypothetical protein
MFAHEIASDAAKHADNMAYMAELRGKWKLQAAVLKWALENSPALREAGLMQGLVEVMQKEVYE